MKDFLKLKRFPPIFNWVREGWVVSAILIISLLATVAGFVFEKRQTQNRSQLIFEDHSRIVMDDLVGTMNAYELFLRGGMAFFRASEDVTREEWHSYVAHLQLAENYPGILGVGYNAVLRGTDDLAQFERDIQKTGLPDFTIRPVTEFDLHVPVVYLEPLTAQNQRALGFDIYSESRRRAAIDRAMATGKASLTERITLVQEGKTTGTDGVHYGVLLMLPVYGEGRGLESEEARVEAATGMIVSVFRMQDLVMSVLSKPGLGAADLVQVGLYDAATVDPDALLFKTSSAETGAGYSDQKTVDLFGRKWTFQMHSTPEFDRRQQGYTKYLVLVSGLLMTLLLTSLAMAQARRHHEALRAGAELEDSNNKIALLMAEVNHRSKNLLAVVQSIARLSSKGGSESFANSFSKRLSALSSSQNLLAKSEWREISLDQLIRSQLAHFQNLIGDRITLGGETVQLSAETAQTLGMAMHELSTNASKYGALSTDHGRVDIHWHIAKGDEETFHLSWVERGGPTVVAPERKGFGTMVTGSMVKMSLSGRISASYDEEGFAWHLECPTEKILDRRSAEETGGANGKR